MPPLFKKCPSCGKMFEVEHVGEDVSKERTLVTEHRTTFESPQDYEGMYPSSEYPAEAAETITGTPDYDVEVPTEVDTYTEKYVCKHCGHAWTETHEKDSRLGKDMSKGS